MPGKKKPVQGDATTLIHFWKTSSSNTETLWTGTVPPSKGERGDGYPTYAEPEKEFSGEWCKKIMVSRPNKPLSVGSPLPPGEIEDVTDPVRFWLL